MSTRVIYYQCFCDDDLGEAQGFFETTNNKLTMLYGWSLNDANYRQEYMGGLMKKLGVEVKILAKKHEAKAKQLMKEWFGL